MHSREKKMDAAPAVKEETTGVGSADWTGLEVTERPEHVCGGGGKAKALSRGDGGKGEKKTKSRT